MNKISDLKVGDKVALQNGKIDIVTKITFCGGANLAKSKHIHNSNVNWQKTNELNNKQMKEFIIECPSGYEIDKEKSTFEKIVFKEIGFKFPESVTEIPNRNWFINGFGGIDSLGDCNHINQLSSKERAEAFLALMQLVELRDYVNGDWKADFKDYNSVKYTIHIVENKIYKNFNQGLSCVLHFKSQEIRDQFAEKYKSLIETAKELL
jgi:sucrose-6-phosphate hydrolase SacC (GH32 family)